MRVLYQVKFLGYRNGSTEINIPFCKSQDVILLKYIDIFTHSKANIFLILNDDEKFLTLDNLVRKNIKIS